jgi:O-methyltransferase / aklanonic acid methyltransferase
MTNNSSDLDQQKKRITGIFSRAADTYDHIGPRFFAYFGQRLVDFAQLSAGDRVLDIATGRGAILFPAAQAVGESGYVVGTDISMPMVEETRHEIHDLDLKNVTVSQMDGEGLQFPDRTFDVILCGFALFFFPHLEQALAEMQRVLRPGGRLAVSTWEKYEDEQWSWFDKLVETFLPPEPQQDSKASSQPPPLELDTPAGMEKVLTAAGFSQVQYRTERFEVIYQDREQWWSAQWSHGGRALLETIEEKLGPAELERFKGAVFEGLSKHQPTGGVHTNWPALYVKAIKPET